MLTTPCRIWRQVSDALYIRTHTFLAEAAAILFSISNVVCYCVIKLCQVRLTHSNREFSDSTICFGAQVGGQEIPLNYPEVQGKIWIWTSKRLACLKTGREAEEEIQFT